MKTIFGLTLKSAARDPFLLLWSLIIPIGGSVALGLLIKIPAYPLRIMTGMIASSILFYALITTAFAVMAQRRRGVYSLLHVTPMKLWKYIFSLSSARTLVAVICGIIVMTVCVAVFRYPLSVISLLLLLPVMLAATIGFVFLSFFIASLARAEAQMSMITNMIMMPLLFCSDAYYPLDKAPAWLQGITQVNPFQWFVSGLRNALDMNIGGYMRDMGLLFLLLAVTLLLALRTFRYTD